MFQQDFSNQQEKDDWFILNSQSCENQQKPTFHNPFNQQEKQIDLNINNFFSDSTTNQYKNLRCNKYSQPSLAQFFEDKNIERKRANLITKIQQNEESKRQIKIDYKENQKFIRNQIKNLTNSQQSTIEIPETKLGKNKDLSQKSLSNIYEQKLKDQQSSSLPIKSQEKQVKENQENGIQEKIVIPKQIAKKLYSYQIDGVNFLYENFKNNQGCIIADDMGLGKTIQALVFLGMLIERQLVNDIMIVCPPTLIEQWISELEIWRVNLREKSNRERIKRPTNNRNNKNNSRFMIVSQQVFQQEYQMFQNSLKLDILLIDEGQKAKNINTITRKGLKVIKVKKMKILLSGTPAQNNVDELYSLFDIVQDGILNSQNEFKMKFSKPIEEGCKSRLQEKQDDAINAANELKFKKDKKDKKLQEKKLQLQSQQEFYEQKFESQFYNFKSLKKSSKRDDEENGMSYQLNLENFYFDIQKQYDLNQIEYWFMLSNKVNILFDLLEDMYNKHNKVVLFTKSVQFLNFLEDMVSKRIDGSTSHSARRQHCESFNDPGQEIFMLILNSQVGGLGLNLIAADRAVILDPDWNPQVDNQCIDRLYRIGQKKDVIVFRFLTVNSVEEHMYRRQIYKSSMTNLAIEKECDDVQRIFDQESLEKLLNFDPNNNKCETLELLEQRNNKKNITIETPSILHTKNFLLNHELIEGISDHLEIFQTTDN